MMPRSIAKVNAKSIDGYFGVGTSCFFIRGTILSDTPVNGEYPSLTLHAAGQHRRDRLVRRRLGRRDDPHAPRQPPRRQRHRAACTCATTTSKRTASTAGASSTSTACRSRSTWPRSRPKGCSTITISSRTSRSKTIRIRRPFRSRSPTVAAIRLTRSEAPAWRRAAAAAATPPPAPPPPTTRRHRRSRERKRRSRDAAAKEPLSSFDVTAILEMLRSGNVAARQNRRVGRRRRGAGVALYGAGVPERQAVRRRRGGAPALGDLLAEERRALVGAAAAC